METDSTRLRSRCRIRESACPMPAGHEFGPSFANCRVELRLERVIMSRCLDWEHWEKRIKNAKERLDFASASIREIKKDILSGAIDQKSGHEAYLQALRTEQAALREYAKAVKAFGAVLPGETGLNAASFRPNGQRNPK